MAGGTVHEKQDPLVAVSHAAICDLDPVREDLQIGGSSGQERFALQMQTFLGAC